MKKKKTIEINNYKNLIERMENDKKVDSSSCYYLNSFYEGMFLAKFPDLVRSYYDSIYGMLRGLKLVSYISDKEFNILWTELEQLRDSVIDNLIPNVSKCS